MINIIGAHTGSEQSAAIQLRDAVVTGWPWIESDTRAQFFIIPNVQCHGESPRDIDIVVVASLPEERAHFKTTKELRTRDHVTVKPQSIPVGDLCVIIEVKDHDLQGTRFSGNSVEVTYQSGGVNGHRKWSNATNQSNKQLHAFRSYFQRQHKNSQLPYIINLIWMRNISQSELEAATKGATTNVLPGQPSLDSFLELIAKNQGLKSNKNGPLLSCSDQRDGIMLERMRNVLTRTVEPTELDRIKIERINRIDSKMAWLSDLGEKQIILEGHGGTGKTAILLSWAWKLKEEEHKRVVILTYNVALVADLRRLLTLMGLVDSVGLPSLQIMTIYTIIFEMLTALGVIECDEFEFIRRHDELKTEALKQIRSGEISSDDITAAKELVPDKLMWDNIFVDEAQDWPEDERDLIHAFYNPTDLVIADGRGQLIRNQQKCDWTNGKTVPTVYHRLTTGMRMKTNLVRFANMLSEELEVEPWTVEENDNAGGGQVIIVEGNPTAAKNIFDEVISDALANENSPVDLLTCVPPMLVEKNVIDGKEHRSAKIASVLEDWGYKSWDGTCNDTRRTYPTSLDQMRIVQYDSCRGLEGWAVFNLALDELYKYKMNQWKKPETAEGELIDEERMRRRFAGSWLMIPCSRAIDTLVINVLDPSSDVGKIMKRMHEQCGDFVRWEKS